MHVCGACNVVCRALYTTDAPRRSIHGSAVIHTSPASNCVPHTALMLSSTCGIATCIACTSVRHVALRQTALRCNMTMSRKQRSVTACVRRSHAIGAVGCMRAQRSGRAEGRRHSAPRCKRAQHVAIRSSRVQPVAISCGAVRHVAARRTTPEGPISCGRDDGGAPVDTTRAKLWMR